MGGDAYLAESLKYGTSVLAMFENPNGNYPPTTGTVILGDDIGGMTTNGVIQNIKILNSVVKMQRQLTHIKVGLLCFLVLAWVLVYYFMV